MEIGDRVITPHGPGEIKAIDLPDSRAKRYGVKHDVFPVGMPRSFKDDILYYPIKDLAKENNLQSS